jgi:hypothetical protein
MKSCGLIAANLPTWQARCASLAAEAQRISDKCRRDVPRRWRLPSRVLHCDLTSLSEMKMRKQTQRLLLLASLAALLLANLGMQDIWPSRRPAGAQADASALGLNVRAFGAIPNDRRDDTQAIQAAIDALPVPNHDGAKGGIVFIPRGTYDVTSLRLPPAVQIVGEGEGTYLVGRSEQPTIALWSPFGHGWVIGSVVRDLKIFSPASECIGIDRNTVAKGNVVNCRFENLNLMSGRGHFALLLDVYSQDCVLRNIKVRNYGGGAVNIFGNANVIDRVNTEGNDADKDFACEPARLTVKGAGNTISGCIIEGGSKPAVAYHVEGQVTWINNWMETPTPKDGIAYRFVDCWGQIDNLKLLTDKLKVQITNSPVMQIGQLDMRNGTFADVFVLDEKSNVVVDLVATQMDCGWLDHERFKIQRVWNEHANVILNNPPTTRGISLLNGGNALRTEAGAMTQWVVEDPMNQPGQKAEFEVFTETSPTGEMSCRIDVKSNPDRHNLGVKVPLKVPAELTGKTAVLQVTIDPKINIWSKNFAKNYPIRVSGERTMCATPPLEADDEINFVISAPEAGKSVWIRGLSVTK